MTVIAPAAKATPNGPSGFFVDVIRVVKGLRFQTRTGLYEVVGDPISMSSRSVSVAVVEVGGRHDGNRFAAYITTNR